VARAARLTTAPAGQLAAIVLGTAALLTAIFAPITVRLYRRA
jgi:hypothetical protein